MEKNEVLGNIATLTTSMVAIMEYGLLSKTQVVLEGLGHTEESLDRLMSYLRYTLTEEEIMNKLEVVMITDYVRALDNLAGHVNEALVENKREAFREIMRQGYEEMGEINLGISEEMKHLEDEGEKVNEMATKNTESNTEAK